METLQKSILLCLVLCVGFAACENRTDERQFHKKALSVFNVVRFPNTACAGTGSQNGTCYTSDECSQRGGTASGTCANSYGVCCIFSVVCGGTSSQNCTYFASATSSQPAGQCSVKICEISDDICQLRLDFTTFTITGPSTITTSVTKALAGAAPLTGAGTEISYATNCLTDKFSVTGNGGASPPVICGNNNNFHMYVDSNPNCNELSFQLGPTGVGASIPTARQWNMKISQISCNSDYAAPPGCTQYFYGSTLGKINSFNWAGGTQLANQLQNICFRREKGFCTLCLSAAGANDFKISGNKAGANMPQMTAINRELECCGYGADGANANGYDCLQIPGALNPAGIGNAQNIPNSFCGGKLAIAGMAQATICTKQTPFMVSFLSDGFTLVKDPNPNLNGFNLDYFQTAC